MTQYVDKFEARLGLIQNSEWSYPIINVSDTMDTCMLWFKTYNVEFTAADLIEMTKLIITEKRVQGME